MNSNLLNQSKPPMEQLDSKTLALYLGCECAVYTDGIIKSSYNATLTSVSIYGFVTLRKVNRDNVLSKSFNEIKLLLRPLSSISEDENIEIQSMAAFDENIRWLKFTGNVAKYLISKQFDLFNLIEQGLALDITKQ